MYVGVPEDMFLLAPQPLPFGVPLRDEQCHALAYRAAFAGLGHVSPNPLVGCVITDAQGCLLAVGSHRRYGAMHAEAEAVAQAQARGGTDGLRRGRIFVTLQPCTHHGKTPPCSELLLRHGLQEVHFGAHDPNPRVSGLDKLQQLGVVCHKYEHRELCWLDEAYFFHAARDRKVRSKEHGNSRESCEHPRPFVAAKLATGLDGSFAAQQGQPRLRLSCERALQYGHFLRQRYDAILVGAGTLRNDNPCLNVRVPLPRRRTPRRVVLADAATLRTKLRIFETDPHTVIVVVPDTEAVCSAPLLPAAATLLPLPRRTGSKFDLSALLQILYREHGIYSLLLEGGGQRWSNFFAAGLVDKVHLFQSARLHAPARYWGAELEDKLSVSLRDVRLLPLASDWVIEGRVDYTAKFKPS